ncbi:MAG: hypothetical protein WCG66_11095 [bacterium]
MENLNPDFLDFITLLEKKFVEYLVVGGYAVGFHGFPRYTGDIDFFVAVSERNAQRLMEVFQEFGFGEIGIEKQDFLKPWFIIEIGREPRKIQVLTGIDGVTFDECRETAVEYDYLGQKMRFIGLEPLIRNKKASGRSKDLIDAQELLRIKS